MKRKNIVLFLTDGQRRDTIGCYGSRYVNTPNIDSFAQESLRFDNAFAVHAVCMPTRASIYTGKYPHVHGVWANGLALSEDELTLPQILADNGYATCACGKVHLEPQRSYPEKVTPIVQELPYYGFQEVHLTENYLGQEYLDFIDKEQPGLRETGQWQKELPEELHNLHWTTSRAIDFIDRSSRGNKPFFCHCSFHEISPPCLSPAGYEGRHQPETVPIPELCCADLAGKPPLYRDCYEGSIANQKQPGDDQLREYIASTYNQAEFIDAQFGRIVDALKRSGSWEDTILIFMTDHGLSYNDHYQWRHGPFLFDEVIRIPMIWRVPGVPCNGKNTTDLVEQVDILPTLLAMNNIPVPAAVQGRSFEKLFTCIPDSPHRESVLIQDRHAPDLKLRGIDPESVDLKGIRTREWKYIECSGKSCGELYHLVEDPGEFNNLWDDPEYRSTRLELASLLERRYNSAEPNFPERVFDW